MKLKQMKKFKKEQVGTVRILSCNQDCADLEVTKERDRVYRMSFDGPTAQYLMGSDLTKIVQRLAITSTADDERYVPKVGELYYYYSPTHNEIRGTEMSTLTSEYNNLLLGNCFKTKEDAEANVKSLKQMYKWCEYVIE